MESKDTNALPRLFLVRHGDTDWTDAHRHTGRTDIPLNAQGEQHARSIGVRLKDEKFARVFISPLVRVRRTCELAGLDAHAEIIPDLTEWNYGDYEGRLTVDVHCERPDWNLYRDGAPGGESPEEVAARADRFLNVVRSLAGDIAAFSSGQMIRMIAARWLRLAPLAAKCFYTATASIGILGYEHNQKQSVVLLWNDVGSLNENG